MPVDVMLHEAREAVRQGQRIRAKDLLARVLQADRNNPEAWLWMSAVVDTSKEYVYCLKKVLELDPENEAARQGLILVGSAAPGKQVKPLPPIRRSWNVAINPEPPSGIKSLWANPFVRWSLFSTVAILVLGLILLGIFWPGRPNQTALIRPTRTPGSYPTFTPTPTYIRLATAESSPDPADQELRPLWMQLEATYTPTPRYVNTPHPISEAYRIAQRAYDRQDWETALQYYLQASVINPEAVDLQYLVGETYLRLERPQEALAAFEEAISLDESFGPAYYGQALARWEIDHSSEVLSDLDLALQYDPNMVETYLEKAAILVHIGMLDEAELVLDQAGHLLPETPWIPLYRAQIYLAHNFPAQAYRQAKIAYDMDRTILPVYLVLAQAAARTKRFTAAQAAIDVYLQYLPEDSTGWLVLGELAYRRGEELEAGLKALERALELDENLVDAYLYRALIFIELEEGQQAVNELVKAREIESDSFNVHLAMGRALMAAGRTDDGYATLSSSVEQAETDAELIQALFWRANAAEMLNRWRDAQMDWQALLEFPAGSVNLDWLIMARERIKTLTLSETPSIEQQATPSPTLTPGTDFYLTPTRTVTPTLDSGTLTPTTTSKLTPTLAGTTRTATATVTP